MMVTWKNTAPVATIITVDVMAVTAAVSARPAR
jgi:hypothetical protein